MTLNELKILRCRKALSRSDLLSAEEKYELARYFMRQKPILSVIKSGNMRTMGRYLRLKSNGKVQSITTVVSYERMITTFYQDYKCYIKVLDAVPFDSLVYVIKGWR